MGKISSLSCSFLVAGVDLSHVLVLAPRHVGRSCVEIGLMISKYFAPDYHPMSFYFPFGFCVYICSSGMYLI
jgi:hypothetical protein